MIIGLIAVVSSLFGGGSLSFDGTFKPFVKDAVVDEQRYDQISEVFDEADDDIEAFRKDFDKHWAPEVTALVGNYDASRDDFRDFRKRMSKPRTAAIRSIIGVRFKMVELMTEDEWTAMFQAADAKAAEKDD